MAVYTSNASYYVLVIQGAHVDAAMTGTRTDAEASAPQYPPITVPIGLFGSSGLPKSTSTHCLDPKASRKLELYPEAPKSFLLGITL